MVKFDNIGSEFSPIVNKTSKNCLRIWRFCQSGEIWPNLVILAMSIKAALSRTRDDWNNQKSVEVVTGEGQWMWLSWQSGRFRLKRSAVRIQSPAKKYLAFIVNCFEKTKIKKKETGNGHLKTKKVENSFSYFLINYSRF